MTAGQKIKQLRRERDITQEQLAEYLDVSASAVSQWERDTVLPDLEKLLRLGDVFHVSMDVLLKDELALDEVKKICHCGSNAVREKKQEVYEGVLIKESITDDAILDLINVHRIELWNTGGRPKYWTVLFFTSDKKDFPERVSEVMVSDPENGGNWFVDFKTGNQKYIVFKNKILKYTIGDQVQKESVCEECRKMGITDTEMNWPE